MQVFKPSLEFHEVIFIPRIETDTINLKIINDLRSNETVMNVIGTIINGVFIGVFEYQFKEGGSYEIEAYDLETRLLFRGKAFATDETDLQNYKLIR